MTYRYVLDDNTLLPASDQCSTVEPPVAQVQFDQADRWLFLTLVILGCLVLVFA